MQDSVQSPHTSHSIPQCITTATKATMNATTK